MARAKRPITMCGGGKPGPGRPKGLQNKTTIAAKEAIAGAFEKMGGLDALVKWAKLNPKEFYTIIWPKIIPLQVGMDPNNPITVTVVELVAPMMKDMGHVELIEHRESTH